MSDLERHAVSLGQRPALLLVDMLNGFTDPSSPLGCNADDVVAANARLLTAFREADLPVFFTTVVYHNDEQAPVFRRRLPALELLKPGSDAVAIDKRLAPRPNEPVIEKQYASSFFGTDLAERLRESQADSLVVTGLTTSGCVRATVVDGLQNDFPTLVPADAVGDRNLDAHAANLHDMHAKYAEVTESGAIIESLSLATSP